jgi:hypothetical protein
MSNLEREEILTPVGRLVMGSLYKARTKDINGKQIVNKQGEDSQSFFFALAIAKGTETHWNQTEWGAKIWNAGTAAVPQPGAGFSWKVVDGDSQEINPNSLAKNPVAPRTIEGYPGHWVLSFSSQFAPKIYDEKGTREITENNFVNPGDYIQVFGTVLGHAPPNPGVYLNHSLVAFSGYGKRISSAFEYDASEVGFGNAPKPAGISTVPIGQAFSPPVNSVSLVAPIIPVVPHLGILNVPVPPATAPVRQMLPAAGGATYEQLRTNGWTDATLIQHGMMAP